MQPLISPSKLFKYSITFQETTEDSREVSDYSNSGYIIENESDIIGNILKKANQVYGIYYPIYFGGWESTYPEQDRDYFEKGVEKYYTLFIKNEDGTDITEEEYDFITFLLSDGNYNKSEFTDYAVGGVVLGALALGVGGLIAYYYFNKRKKGYPTGSAWTKEHYHHNEDEDYEVEPSKRKVPARNRKYDNGGEIQVGNKFGDWSITQYKPIVYEIGGTRDGLIKLVNQDTFDEILVQYDGALRNPKWFARIKGVRVEGKSPKEVIEKLKYGNGGKTEEVYIEFLNKEKGYKKDVKHFNSYEEAVEWAKKNFDKFDYDMIKYKYANGGQIIRFDRHASMDSATRNELVEMLSYPFLLEYDVEENGEIKYDRIKSLLEREGVKVYSIKNYLSGLFDGYNYSNTDDFKKEMAKLKIADKEFYDRIIKVYEKISKYPKIDKMMDNGGRVKKMYYHIIEYGDYGNIGYQGYYETKEEAQKQVDKLSDYFPNQTFQIFVDNSKKEPPITTMNNGGGVENAEMPTRERTTITRPTTTPTTTPSKPDKNNPYKPKHKPKPKAKKYDFVLIKK